MHEINNKIAYLVEFCTGSVDEKSLCKCPFHLCVFWICVLYGTQHFSLSCCEKHVHDVLLIVLNKPAC